MENFVELHNAIRKYVKEVIRSIMCQVSKERTWKPEHNQPPKEEDNANFFKSMRKRI